MISFALLAYNAFSKKEKYWVIIWTLSAIAINPIIKIPLGRFYWNIVDVIWSVLLLISIFISSKEINFYTSNNIMKESKVDRYKKLKKFIAREFLVLLSSVILFLFTWILWVQVNNFLKLKADKLTNEIEELKKFEPYQSLLKYSEEANSGKYSNWEDVNLLFPQLMAFDKQVLKEYVATVNTNKYKDFTVLNSKFPEFGFDSIGVHKNFNILQLEKLQENLKSLESIQASFFYDAVSNDDLFLLGIILVTILFGFRYLYYAVLWSIKTIKE